MTRAMVRDRPLPTIRYNPVRSYEPDESNFLKALAGVRAGDLNPHYHWYGTFFFAPLGAVFAAAHLAGVIRVTSEMTFYLLRPEEMAKIYVAGRLVALAAFALSVWLVHRHGLRRYGAAAGAAAAALWAVSLQGALLAVMIRPDHLANVFLLLYLDRLVSMAEGDGARRSAAVAGIWLGLAANTKYSHGLAAVLLPATALVSSGATRGAVREAVRRTAVGGASAAAAFVATNPFAVLAPAEVWGTVFGLAGQDVLGEPGAAAGLRFYARHLVWGLSLPAALAAAAGAAAALGRRSPADAVHLAWVAVGTAFFALTDRQRIGYYLLPVLPSLCLLAGGWLVPAGAAGRRRAVGVAAAVLVSLWGGVRTATYATAAGGENPRTELGRWIRANVPPGASIGVWRSEYQHLMPPVDLDRYPVVRMAEDPAARPDWVVVPMKEEPLRLVDPDDDATRGRWAALEAAYDEVLRFAPRPRLPVVGAADLPPGEDFYFNFFPEYRIFRRRDR